MVTAKARAISAFVYAGVSVAIGVWRLLQEPGKTTGLYFGLSIGAIAIVAGTLLLIGKRLAGTLICFLAAGLGGGFFVFRLASGGAAGDYLRVGIAACAALAMGVILLMPAQRSG